MQTASDKEVARAACVPLWVQEEGFDIMWTWIRFGVTEGINAGRLLNGLTAQCPRDCTNLTCTQACMICYHELVRSAYGLE